jgi:hypothetical protein
MPATKKLCPECGEELYSVQMPHHRLREHGIEHVKAGAAETVPPKPVPPKPVPELDAPPSEPSPGDTETAPRKPKLLDRFRSRGGRGRGGQHQTPAPGERVPKRAPKRTGKRVSLDTDVSDIWAFGGRRLEGTAHYPTGRMLQYQAPAAGVILDRAVAGTLPDRMLFQPLARNRDKYEDVGFLLAGPLLTFSITTTGQRIQQAAEAGDKEVYDDLVGKLQMQREMFTWVLSMMLPRLAEGAKLAREKKAKADAVISDAFPELGDEDPVEVLAAMLFQPPGFEEAQNNGKSDNASAPSRPEGAVSL